MTFFSGQILWVPFIGYFFWFSWKTKGKKFAFSFGLFLLLVLVCTDVTSSYILKNSLERLRPCRELDLKLLIYNFGQKCGGKYGFVSSHAANSMGLVLFSMLSLSLRNKTWIWFMPIMVSFSRIYLGVHYPGDIVGGVIVGLFFGYLYSWLFRNIQGAKR